MSQKFYVDARRVGNKVYVREIIDGKAVDRKVDFSPTMYVRSTETTKFTDIYGNPLKPVEFDSIYSAQDYLKKYQEIDNYRIYGNKGFEYQWITENYPDHVDFDVSKIKIFTVDIETATESGFPNISLANEEILLISIMDFHTKEVFSFGSRPFNEANLPKPLNEFLKNADKFTYILCDDEKDLLQRFLRGWSDVKPHIVTGWNVQFFDIPYLVHRINRILGEEYTKLLSPWKMFRERDVNINGKEQRTYEIYGVAVIDYLDAYKKFGYSGTQESYKLDHIAEVELKRKKLSNPYDTFKDFYTKAWDLFVAYNGVDSELVDELEDNKKLLELIIAMAFDVKCNFNDVFSAVKTWEIFLHNHLASRRVILPVKSKASGRKIEGAYVQEIEPSAFDWVVSFDAASLYPSILMQYNMSPETITPIVVPNVTVKSMLDRETDFAECYEKDLAVVANGHTFRRDKKGIFPEVTDLFFTKRKQAKAKMLDAKRQYEATKNPEFKRIASIENSKQMSAKILLNSLYGASASPFFVFYDDRIAEGITLTGQFIIREVGQKVDEYLNKVCGTKNVSFTKYRDTDSLYLSLGPLVDKFYRDKTKEQIVDILDSICKTKLTECITKACVGIAEYTNAFERRLDFKREAIADRALWTGKKRYAANVYDNEGVRYATPELKVTGFEIVRSTTPMIVRNLLKEAMKLCLTASESDIQTFVQCAEEEFKKVSPDQIAMPKSANNLEKYSDHNDIYKKGCPIHVRGALLHNHLIRAKGLEHTVQEISEGDKIKHIYLKLPNTIHENIISFSGTLPKEFGLHRFVDYELMFEKTFLEPLEKILTALRWSITPVATLDSLF